jgi:hypothetical protein
MRRSASATGHPGRHETPVIRAAVAASITATLDAYPDAARVVGTAGARVVVVLLLVVDVVWLGFVAVVDVLLDAVVRRGRVPISGRARADPPQAAPTTSATKRTSGRWDIGPVCPAARRTNQAVRARSPGVAGAGRVPSR